MSINGNGYGRANYYWNAPRIFYFYGSNGSAENTRQKFRESSAPLALLIELVTPNLPNFIIESMASERHHRSDAQYGLWFRYDAF